MRNIDIEVTKEFDHYNAEVRRVIRTFEPLARRKAIGVFSVLDRVTSAERTAAETIIAEGRVSRSAI